jgi:hypothetical protein
MRAPMNTTDSRTASRSPYKTSMRGSTSPQATVSFEQFEEELGRSAKTPGSTRESRGFGEFRVSDVVVELELPMCRWRWL